MNKLAEMYPFFFFFFFFQDLQIYLLRSQELYTQQDTDEAQSVVFCSPPDSVQTNRFTNVTANMTT